MYVFALALFYVHGLSRREGHKPLPYVVAASFTHFEAFRPSYDSPIRSDFYRQHHSPGSAIVCPATQTATTLCTSMVPAQPLLFIIRSLSSQV